MELDHESHRQVFAQFLGRADIKGSEAESMTVLLNALKTATIKESKDNGQAGQDTGNSTED